jgi:hypothetical protein
VLGEVGVFADRAEKHALLAPAQFVVVRLVGDIDDLVGAREFSVGSERRVVQEQRLGF